MCGGSAPNVVPYLDLDFGLAADGVVVLGADFFSAPGESGRAVNRITAAEAMTRATGALSVIVSRIVPSAAVSSRTAKALHTDARTKPLESFSPS
jgi:hypothetical protein